MIYRSRVLVPISSPPVDDGAVAVVDGCIVASGPFKDLRAHFTGDVVDLGERVLLPGLINSHCHLDYTMMRHALDPPHSFADWIRRLNALKRSLDPEDYLQAIARGFEELIHWGVTTVLNIESFPELLLQMPPPPIRTWWFYEMIDIRHRVPSEEVVVGALTFFHGRREWLGGFGLSPHAPYTASIDLYQRAAACAARLGLPVTTHVAESAEEDWMFRDRAGDLYRFLEELKRPMNDCSGHSSFWNLCHTGGINSDTLLVHLNELNQADLELLARPPLEGRVHVVHCPQSHAYFRHRPFAFETLYRGGANICLGTDSLASCDSLNLFIEMRRVRDAQPWLQPEEILKTVTINPARALKLDGRLGQITPGACADLISLPFTGNIAAVSDEIIAHERPIDWMMLNGENKPH